MRILRVIAGVDPAHGGPIEGLRLTAQHHAAMGHQTEVATLDDPASAHVADFPFQVHACGPGFRRYGYTPRLADWIAANGNRYDAAIVHGLWNHASIGGWAGLRRAGVPYLVMTHGMMDPWFRKAYPVKHMAKQVFWTLAQGKVLRDAASVLFTCEEERRLARGVFGGHAYTERVIAYGTADPPPADAADEAALASKVPALGDRKFLLFLSRIHEKKGVDMLVDAFARIAAAHPDIDLVVAGPDQDGLQARLSQQATRAGIADRLHWPGMLTRGAKWAAFRKAAAFVLPSHQENFGIVVAEAMACGTPVLTTDKVNIWRELDASGGGFIETDTTDGIQNLLQRFLALSPAEKAAMAAKARAGFERHFRVEQSATDIIAALDDAKRGHYDHAA